MMTMSASPLFDLPSLSWSATRLAASTGLPTVMSSMPAGLTSDGQLVGDSADEADAACR